VLRRRRMVRDYADRPLDDATVERILGAALRAPSAGFSQGWAFLALTEASDRREFWRHAGHMRDAAPTMSVAPLVVVALASKDAYLDRYAESDKGWTDRDEARWPVPYWYIDTGMAALLMLLTAVDEGLGACFFGIVPEDIAPLRAAFDVPDQFVPIGAVTVGYRSESLGAQGPRFAARRRSADEVIHRGRWQRHVAPLDAPA